MGSPPEVFGVCSCTHFRASAAWSLWNMAELTAAIRSRPPLRINMDETRITLHCQQRRGLKGSQAQLRALSRGSRRSKSLVQNVSLKQKRGGFTHIAMICDDSSIQPRLPQILLGNEHTFPAATLSSLQPTLPPNIILWRRKSGWVTKSLMRSILKELSRALAELKASRQVILLLDTAGVHICPYFLRAASREGIIVQYVPAKLTWLLQPLDTHAFARFKLCLHQQYRRHVMRTNDGKCELSAMILLVAVACRKVFQGTAWKTAFVANGYGSLQRHVRTSVLEALDWERAPELAAGLPTFKEIEYVFSTANCYSPRGILASAPPTAQRASSRT